VPKPRNEYNRKVQTRRERKVLEYKRGKPGLSAYVTPAELAQAVRHLNALHDEGMSWGHMSYQIQGSTSNHAMVSRHANGRTIRMTRPVFDTYMALRFDDTIRPVGHESTIVRCRGAQVVPLGSVRRIQALAAAGFPLKWLEGNHGEAALHRLAAGEKAFLWADRAIRIRGFYDKLQHVVPEHVGIDPVMAGRARKTAAAKHWAPPSCWDVDTIDDPGAVPEWTGACGSNEGYNLHRKGERKGEHFVCQPCRTAHNEYTAAGHRKEWGNATKVDPARMFRLLAEGMTAGQVAETMGVAVRTIERTKYKIKKEAQRAEQTEN